MSSALLKRSSRRPRGSRPSAGSSRNTTAGSLTATEAIMYSKAHHRIQTKARDPRIAFEGFQPTIHTTSHELQILESEIIYGHGMLLVLVAKVTLSFEKAAKTRSVWHWNIRLIDQGRIGWSS